MAILQFDGFDHYGTSAIPSNTETHSGFFFANAGYINPNRSLVFGTAYGRMAGSYGARLTTAAAVEEGSPDGIWISKPIQPEQWKEQTAYAPERFVILGFAFRTTGVPVAETKFCRVGQHYATVGSDMKIRVDGLETNYEIELSIWNYFELEVNIEEHVCRMWANDRLIHEVQLAESQIILDTWAISAQHVTSTLAGGTIFEVDDMYLMDGKGDVNNKRLGKVSVLTRYPKRDVQREFVPSSGTTNWDKVDEQSLDNSTTYVSTAVVGATDIYANDDVVTAIDENAIVAVGVSVSARMTEPDSLSVAAVISSGGEEAEGGRMALKAAKFQSEKAVFETDPATGSRWRLSAIQTLQWGQRILDRVLS